MLLKIVSMQEQARQGEAISQAVKAMQSGVRDFAVYYRPGSSKASFIIPSDKLLPQSSMYSIKHFIPDDREPLIRVNGRAGVRGLLDGEPIDLIADNFGKLVLMGKQVLSATISGSTRKAFSFGAVSSQEKLNTHEASIMAKAREVLDDMMKASPELGRQLQIKSPAGYKLRVLLQESLKELLMNAYDVTKQRYLENNDPAYKPSAAISWSFDRKVLSLMVTDNGVGGVTDPEGSVRSFALSSDRKNELFQQGKRIYMGGRGVGLTYWKNVPAVRQSIRLDPGKGVQLLTVDLAQLHETGWQ